MFEHTAEVRGLERGRIHQREECSHHREKVWWLIEELHRRGILGQKATFVSTVGLDEAMVRAYIRNQEEEDEHCDQMKLGV